MRASALALSPRTLQRQPRRGEHSGFRGYWMRLRKDMAVIYLRDPTLSVLDVVLAARLCRTQFIHAGVSGLVQLQSFGLAPGARRRASLNARKRPGDSVLLHAPDLL
jgi:AraC-like DNA-binding protein